MTLGSRSTELAFSPLSYPFWLYVQNLELKKLNDEKKAALAAQFAAEATLRRVQAAQKDEEMPSIEAILAPIEAELKLARQEVSRCQGRAGLSIAM